MSNKIFIILLFIAIIGSTFINHKVYGNSNFTISNYEIAKNFTYKERKIRRAKILADYTYNRIKYYQQLDDWWERRQAVWAIYNGLQKEGL